MSDSVNRVDSGIDGIGTILLKDKKGALRLKYMTEDDLPAVTKLNDYCSVVEFDCKPRSRDGWLSWMQDEKMKCFVIEIKTADDFIFAGTTIIQRMDDLTTNIFHLAVCPEYRNHGVGVGTIKALLLYAENKGYKFICFSTFAPDPDKKKHGTKVFDWCQGLCSDLVSVKKSGQLKDEKGEVLFGGRVHVVYNPISISECLSRITAIEASCSFPLVATKVMPSIQATDTQQDKDGFAEKKEALTAATASSYGVPKFASHTV